MAQSNGVRDEKMNKHQLIPTVQGTQLEAWGDRDIVREMSDRLYHLHPAAREFGQQGVIMLAQIAITHGANPLPSSGEVWIWRGRDGSPQVDLGVNYYRRVANKTDMVIWVEEPRIMTPEEREEEGLGENDIGAICKAAMLSDVQEIMDKLDCNYKTALDMVARTATGVVAESDQTYQSGGRKGQDIDPPSGRSWRWVARKRAEKDWYKANATFDSHTIRQIERVQEILSQMDREIETRTRKRTPEEINRELGLTDPYNEAAEEKLRQEREEDTVEGDYEEMGQDPDPDQDPDRIAQDQRYVLEAADWPDFAKRATEIYHAVIDDPEEVLETVRSVADGLQGVDFHDAHGIVKRYAMMVADGVPLEDARDTIRKQFNGEQ